LENKILTIKNLDFFAAFSFFLLSYIFYFTGCEGLLATGFYEQINIAFDLDQSHYFHSVGREATDGRVLLIKHPFIYLYHYIVLALNIVGVSDNMAVIMISQFFHSGSLFVCYYIFRIMSRSMVEASLLTFGLAGTSVYISTGLVLDVYTVSIFWISLIFLIVCRSIYQNVDHSIWLRAFISIMAIGTTSYLIILVFLMEYSLVRKNGGTVLNSFIGINLYKQLTRIFILGVSLFCIVYFQVITDTIQDPVGVLKRIFWTVNRPGEKTGIFQVITVFILFSIVSPKVSSIILPEGVTMIDLRVIEFSFVGWVAVIIIVLSIFSKYKLNKHRFIFLFSFTWLIFNLFFHTIYQYRGSLFLYCGHFFLAIWIMLSVKINTETIDSIFQRNIHKFLDILFVYFLPFIIFINNIYLYNNIII